MESEVRPYVPLLQIILAEPERLLGPHEEYDEDERALLDAKVQVEQIPPDELPVGVANASLYLEGNWMGGVNTLQIHSQAHLTGGLGTLTRTVETKVNLMVDPSHLKDLILNPRQVTFEFVCKLDSGQSQRHKIEGYLVGYADEYDAIRKKDFVHLTIQC